MTRAAAEVEAEVEAQRSRLDETAHALKDKMTPGEVFDEASRAMGDAGQQVLAKFIEQARRNPMPVALVGVGLVWLMKSSDRDDTADYGPRRRGLSSSLGDGMSHASSGLASAADAARERARGVGQGVKQGAQHLGEKAQDLGDGLARRAQDLQDEAAGVVSQAKEKVSDMKDQIGDTLDHAREAGRSAVGKVNSTAQNASRLAQDSGRWFGQVVDEVVHGEPLILGALGVAVGFAIGSALPRTSVEDQTLGPAHDKLMEKGREAAQEVIEEAGNVAQAAYAAAREEMQPSGEEHGEAGKGQQPRPETV
jgi:ElaB/YqjD/DUF883 family membrane-anchored ribosome-binding protein